MKSPLLSILGAILTGICCFCPSTALALDCLGRLTYVLESQEDVDNFQADYGPSGGGVCDRAKNGLQISGPDITNLDGLSDIVIVEGDLWIRENPLLTNIDGLSSLTRVGRYVWVENNPELTDVNGLSALTEIGFDVRIANNTSLLNVDGLSVLSIAEKIIVEYNDSLTNIDGLSNISNASLDWMFLSHNPSLENLDGISRLNQVNLLVLQHSPLVTSLSPLSDLTSVGDLNIGYMSGLTDLSGLSGITNVDERVRVFANGNLTSLHGLNNLTTIGDELFVWNNFSLTNIDALAAVQRAGSVNVSRNSSLADCAALITLVDSVDDYTPGPGPGVSGIPDIATSAEFDGNKAGCNSVPEILGLPMVEPFNINPGLTDAWYNRATSGQGFLLAVFPDIKQMFLAWFTFDTQRPPEDAVALLGEPGHRWLTAQGPYDGDTAELTIFVTKGGAFDAIEPKASTDPLGDGTLIIEFADCNSGLVSYEITSLGISGEIPIERVALDNVPLCESLNAQ